MRLRTRLTTAIIAISTIGTLLLGGVAITEVRTSRIAAVDRALLSVTTQIEANPRDPVGAALLAVDRSASPVALGFLAPGTGFTWLRDLTDVVVAIPNAVERREALHGPADTHGGLRIAATKLKDGAVLVVVASLADVDQQTANEVVFLATFWLLLTLVMGLLIRMLVRRDIREIEHLITLATRIAEDTSGIDIPVVSRATEVGELAAALRSMVASLRSSLVSEQAANQRMQEFLGDASHELRTPLTVLKGYLELLERDVEPEQRERAMHRMRAEAQRMELLINDLLFLAEIGSPAPELLSNIDLSELVRIVSDDLRELQPERSVDVSLADAVEIRAVLSHVQHAVGNSFSNIRRHTAATDPVRITLRADATAAHLIVEDGGPGLSEQMYDRGIAHFRRFDKARSRNSGGSGLGMSIISAVMQEVGGDVAISRSSLGGLCVEFTFPLAVERRAHERPPGAQAAGRASIS